MMHESLLAFDLGGTRVKAGLVSRSDGGISSLMTAEVGDGFDDALDSLMRLGKSLLDEKPCAGVGMCVPGLVDERGVVVSLPGKLAGIEGRDLPGELERAFGLRCVVVNDALAYGAGEAAFGAGRGLERVVVITVGTGIGVTVFEEGMPLGRGVLGGGILGGQIPISERTSGPEDTSGRSDTIEALCRAERIVEYANREGGSYASVPEVYAAYRDREPAALTGIGVYRDHLARALVALAHAHAPDAIVLGGGPMTPDNPIVEGIEDEVNRRLFGSFRVVTAVAVLGDGAALAGLARLYGSSSA